MMALVGERLAVMQPLPLVPPGSVMVADGVSLLEDDDRTGTIFVWGQATWTWDGDDVAARRLAAVQLVNAKPASQRQVAAAFRANETTLWRWRCDYANEGLQGLIPTPMGPKGPSKLTNEKVGQIRELRSLGKSLAEVAQATGVSEKSVRRALGRGVVPALSTQDPSRPGELVPLALPVDREAERGAARRGMLDEAAPVICEGSHLPLLGALLILPALVATGLLEACAAIYGAGRHVNGTRRAAFYGLRSLVLALVFSCLIGEPRAEGLTRVDPVAIGRLLGLDRAPEVTRLRFRLAELAAEHKADELVMALAAHHVNARPEAVGLFYVDGHVRAYHGKKAVSKAHVARMRIAMPGETDTWICDRFGDGLLVWQAAPGASLAGELKIVTSKIRALLGESARPTICFDRGGWSPKLFAQLEAAGFHILTYRKGPSVREPHSAFSQQSFTDELGRTKDYMLADRKVRIAYDAKRRYFSCRQITRLDEQSGHQTQVITTRDDPDAALVAHAMFSRWREENFFRYMRAHYGLDALDAYETTPDDAGRLVANPARRDADRKAREAAASIAAAEGHEGRGALKGQSTDAEVRSAFVDAYGELDSRVSAARAIPAKVPLGQIRPGAVRLDVERKRIMDAIRMATYNAESAIARLIAPHYARAEDEARSLLHEIFRASADAQIDDTTLHVRINVLSAPRRTRALAELCEELTATATLYPGTNLTLAYSVKQG